MSRSDDQRLFERLASRALTAVRDGGDRDRPVVEYASPETIRAALEPSVGLELDPDDRQHPPDALVAAVDQVLRFSVRTAHPRFLNQLFAAADPIGVAGDWLGASVNTTGYTYEAAPVFTLMENAVLGRLARLVGWRVPSDEAAPGVFCPGGAISNLYALALARHRADPESRRRGARGGPELVAFTSAHGHYSIPKGMAFLGLGSDQLVSVPCDEGGRMRPEALAAAVAEVRSRGGVPFFVNATAGTTVTGAFDPVAEIGSIAAEHGLWLHVDGAFGGAALLSERHRGLLDGVDRADSFSWNPHKMLGITQQCAMLLVRRPAWLREAFSSGASYLFQPDKNFAHLDRGDLGVQCGRRVDVLKLWLVWKARGEAVLAARIERAVDLAGELRARLQDRSDRFQIAVPPSFAHVCFWWLPPDLRPFDPDDPRGAERLHRVGPAIKDRLQRSGVALINVQPIGRLPNAFRVPVVNPAVTTDDLDAILDAIDRIGSELYTPSAPAPAE